MNDDKLILYYYDDGLSAAERREIESALANDPQLAARYRQLQRDLADIAGTVDDEPVEVPAHMVHRWHDTIDRAAQAERGRARKPGSGFSFMSFFWGVAVTASLAVGVAIGVLVSGGDAGNGALFVETTPDRSAPTPDPLPAAMPAAFARGLQVHLRDSQRDISALSDRSDADRVLLIMDILQQNRLYERAAEQSNAPKLARVLRAFEPILVRLAAEDITPDEAAALREQLAFELNVMLTKLERESSEEPQTI